MNHVDLLINMIDNNDYEKLENFINNNPYTFGYNYHSNTRMNTLHRSIFRRSYECFDLLLSINNINLNTGFDLALDYYINAPNVKNLYFLERLLLKNVNITPSHVIMAKNNNSLFDLLFEKIEKTTLNIEEIIIDIINDTNKFTKLFNYVKNSNDLDKDPIINSILEYTIYNDKIDIMLMLKLSNNNIKSLKTKHGEIIPTLFYSYNTNNKLVFNFLLDYFNTLSNDELQVIPGIQNILYLSTLHLHNFNKIELYKILDILLKNIKFDNLLVDIFNYFINNNNTHLFSFNLFPLYYILKNQTINIESFIFINNNIINKYIILLNLINEQTKKLRIYSLKNTLINICYILENFNINILSLFDGIFKKLFTDNELDKSLFDYNKEKCICMFS